MHKILHFTTPKIPCSASISIPNCLDYHFHARFHHSSNAYGKKRRSNQTHLSRLPTPYELTPLTLRVSLVDTAKSKPNCLRSIGRTIGRRGEGKYGGHGGWRGSSPTTMTSSPPPLTSSGAWSMTSVEVDDVTQVWSITSSPITSSIDDVGHDVTASAPAPPSILPLDYL
jgi:hypothetical protein